MNYALIQDGVVANIIWLYEGNADEFPDAVPTRGLAVHIGDTYENGLFYRDGEQVRTDAEQMAEALKVLGVDVNE